MTGNFTSIARPYALAAFEYALATNALPAWENALHTATGIINDPSMVRLMASPETSVVQLTDLICGLLKSTQNKAIENFIHLLAEQKRFPVLPEIAYQFDQYRAEHEKKMKVEVTSAVSLSDDQKTKLSAALTKKLQRAVTLECTIDPDLLGGAIIRAGDKVIDGSVRGKLNRMIEFI